MARFLEGIGLSHGLAQIIKGAQERLILISPYLKISERFKELLEERAKDGLDIRILYGTSELRPQEEEWLASLRSVRSGTCKNLHAKCYMNEKEALITSMNFYEYSQVNNNEMGIAITKAEDTQAYNDALQEAVRLIKNCQEKVTPDNSIKKEAPSKDEGFCIRCGTHMRRNPRHPYCLTDFESWRKYGDKAYVEKNGHCHACGRPNASSMERPVCVECYKKRGKAERVSRHSFRK